MPRLATGYVRIEEGNRPIDKPSRGRNVREAGRQKRPLRRDRLMRESGPRRRYSTTHGLNMTVLDHHGVIRASTCPFHPAIGMAMLEIADGTVHIARNGRGSAGLRRSRVPGCCRMMRRIFAWATKSGHWHDATETQARQFFAGRTIGNGLRAAEPPPPWVSTSLSSPARGPDQMPDEDLPHLPGRRGYGQGVGDVRKNCGVSARMAGHAGAAPVTLSLPLAR